MLAHWNNSPLVDKSPHSDTLYWFQANQTLLFLFNAACLAEKQHIPILVFGLAQAGLEPTIYHTRGEHANHYVTDAVISVICVREIGWNVNIMIIRDIS